jgi:hypothetical protein
VQFIIADAVANSHHGDDEALRHTYKCKLAHLMETYRVYDFVFIQEHEALMDIFAGTSPPPSFITIIDTIIQNKYTNDAYIADTRFRRDSYYVQSTGPPGPVLVDWVKANYVYIRAAKEKFPILHSAEQIRLEAFRFKALHGRKSEEISELDRKIFTAQETLAEANKELEELQHALLKANDLLEFISGRYAVAEEGKPDYYKQVGVRIT